VVHVQIHAYFFFMFALSVGSLVDMFFFFFFDVLVDMFLKRLFDNL
jgi:hypothetical protein